MLLLVIHILMVMLLAKLLLWQSNQGQGLNYLMVSGADHCPLYSSMAISLCPSPLNFTMNLSWPCQRLYRALSHLPIGWIGTKDDACDYEQ